MEVNCLFILLALSTVEVPGRVTPCLHLTPVIFSICLCHCLELLTLSFKTLERKNADLAILILSLMNWWLRSNFHIFNLPQLKALCRWIIRVLISGVIHGLSLLWIVTVRVGKYLSKAFCRDWKNSSTLVLVVWAEITTFQSKLVIHCPNSSTYTYTYNLMRNGRLCL